MLQNSTSNLGVTILELFEGSVFCSEFKFLTILFGIKGASINNVIILVGGGSIDDFVTPSLKH